MLNRRQLLVSLAALGSTAAAARFPRRRHADGPNVLLIVLDDLCPRLACYGHAQVHSPNIDALAAEGVLFTSARAPVALCTPSRASLLTGLRPDTLGVHELQDTLAEKAAWAPTLPRLFRERGYASRCFGKIFHHGLEEDPAAWSEPPWDPGDALRDYLDPASIAAVRAERRSLGGKGRLGPSGEAPEVPDEAYVDGRIVGRALEALAEPRAEPLFLAVGLHRPHMPFSVPKRYWDLYDPEALPMPEVDALPKGIPGIAIPGHKTHAYTDLPEDGSRGPEDLRRLLHGYHAAVSYADAQVGRLLEGLARSGRDRDTMVVLLGDHGMHLGDHGLWGKHSNFDVATHAPLILRMPDGEHGGRRVSAMVELVDLAPTLIAACGLRAPGALEGDSLLPLVDGSRARLKSAVFWQYLRRGVMGRTIRTERWRYTRYTRDQTGEVVGVELYDHEADPNETLNLARGPERRETCEELERRLDRGWPAARLPERTS